MSEHPIITLTPEQEALIPIYQEKWRKIALSTERIDRQKAADAVKAAYKWFDSEAPEIIFVDSPYEGFKQLSDYSQDYLDFSLTWDLRHPLIDYDYEKIHNATAIYERTIIEQDLLQLFLEISYNIYSALEDCFLETDISIPDEYSEGCPNIDFFIPESCFYDFCISVLNLPFNPEKWQIFKDLVQFCGWIISYKNICFVCNRPIKLSFDNQNRLHAEGQPAIEYADGFKVYAHHGVWQPEA